MRVSEIFKRPCKRCGKEIYTTERAVRHTLGGICENCTTEDEKWEILNQVGQELYNKARKVYR